MTFVRNIARATLLASTLSLLLPAAPAAAQPIPRDVITVGIVSGNGVVDVPVYIRDVSNTTLGIDQPAGSRIQAYSLKVNYAPASAVQSITFTRAGITAGLTPTFENSPAAAGTISLLDSFSEATNLIPFTLDTLPPGNLVAHLLVTVDPSVAPGTVITLTLDPTLTQLTDDGGNAATLETVANNRLALIAGAITVTAPATAVPSDVPTLGQWGIAVLAGALALVALRLRF
jgi:hypothetical protein